MNKLPPKYSIIIPSCNGLKYLPSCIETIINQSYEDYELIISDDNSSDGTREYLESLHNPKLQIIFPAQSLSMTEHWEWALLHANGEWQIFVGQDDGLQPYFFELADKLTKIAEEKKLRTIMSSRAYYYWQGCEPVYGDVAVNYKASNKVKIRNSFYEATKALLGIQDYFELPEMYTTSLFHQSILEEARARQNGKVLTCHPQDANLGVIACSLEKEYLKSYIPLGWVGSSPSSAGMSIGSASKGFKQDDANTLENLEREYTEKIKKSKFKYNKLAGDFSFGDNSLYFWQAFLETPSLRSNKKNVLLNSKFFKYVFFSFLLIRILKNRKKLNKLSEFRNILSINKCSYTLVYIVSLILYIPLVFINFLYLGYRVVRKIYSLTFGHNGRVFFNRSDNQDLSIDQASKCVLEKIVLPRF